VPSNYGNGLACSLTPTLRAMTRTATRSGYGSATPVLSNNGQSCTPSSALGGKIQKTLTATARPVLSPPQRGFSMSATGTSATIPVAAVTMPTLEPR
jgi:hypothetical protein